MPAVRRARRVMLLASAVSVLALAAGCEVAVDVGLDVEADGSGQVAVAVELDAEAAGRLPDLATQLRLDDLVAGGWTVDGPRPVPGGAQAIVARRSFSTPGEATQVLGQLGGPDGPFRQLELRRQSSFLATDFTFTGAVDLSAGVDAFADPELRALLEGSGFSLETAALERTLGAPVGDSFRFGVRISLPGRPTVEGPGRDEGGTVEWALPVGERTTLAATSELVHQQRLAWLAVSATAGIAAVVVLAAGRRRRRTS